MKKYFLIPLLLAEISYALPVREFDDQALHAFIEKKQNAAILFFNPQMIESVLAVREASVAALALDLPLQIVLDPHSDMSMAELWRQRLQLEVTEWHILTSSTLLQLGMSNHYPSLAFIHEGHLKPSLHQGLENRCDYQNILGFYLGKHYETSDTYKLDCRAAWDR